MPRLDNRPIPILPPLPQAVPPTYNPEWARQVHRTVDAIYRQILSGDIEARANLISDHGRVIGLDRIAAGSYQILASHDCIDVNFAGAVSLTLPREPLKGQRVFVEDSSGAAATNNITINPAPGQLLNGSASGIAIASNYGRALCLWTGVQWILAGLINGSVVTPIETIYDLAAYRPGVYIGGQRLIKLSIVRACAFPAGLTGSAARLDAAATNQTDFDLRKNTVSFGTCRVAAGAVIGSFISAAGVTFAANDYYEIYGPGTADSSAAGLSCTLKGQRP